MHARNARVVNFCNFVCMHVLYMQIISSKSWTSYSNYIVAFLDGPARAIMVQTSYDTMIDMHDEHSYSYIVLQCKLYIGLCMQHLT